MPTLKQIIFASVLVCSLLATAAAQESTTTQRSSLTITAKAVDDRVRITAPSSVVQIHVEVYALGGEKLFDQEIRGGNVFDWHLQDGQGQRLAPGDYVCVVTAKSISGRLTQKIGTVSVAEKSASVQPAESQQLSAPQAQTIGPVEENSSWTIAAKDEPQTGTVIANDGTDGQMIRGRGALTFRIGDFFSGVDQEQMRLTEAGNLGIGTSDPKATLDVAGTIRAQRFLVAKPNRPAGDLKTQATDAADSVQPLIAGTGTQDRIAKWTDNSGTLGDSSITETAAGFVGIGTTTPGSRLVVSANSAALPAATGVARFADADGGQTAVFADAFSNNAIFNVRRANGTAASPSALQANQLIGVNGASGYGASTYMGTRARVAFWASEMWTNTANGTYLTFNTTANGAATPGGSERMRIDNAGNVGIGTTMPGARLAISGNGTDVLIGDAGCGPPTAAIGFGTMSGCNNFALGGDVSNTGNAGIYLNRPIGQSLHFRENNGPDQMTIAPGGYVGVGTTSPVASLDVNGKARFLDTVVIGSTNPNAVFLSKLYVDGFVQISRVDGIPAATHVCIQSTGYLVNCASAAEYVPAMGNSSGYPEATDLVSLFPAVKNPHDDEHAPFVVAKSSKPCDENLLGFITDPEKGGDGKKLNDHYLPLAIYGYFPAKVTMENGAIKRGDPITSSSKPGYGMKATQACKIVGYALEDTNKEGTIQVFARHGENAAPAVTALQAQVRQLQREKSRQMEALQTQSAKLQARLNALEQAVQRSTQNSSLVTPRRSGPRRTGPGSAPTASKRLIHGRAITRSRTD